MTITYVDVFGSVILPSLEKLIEAEFGTRTYVSDVFERHGFRLNPLESEHLTRPNAGESRTYTIELVYTVDMKSGRERMSHLLDVFSRLARLIGDNNVYRVSSVYKWHDGELGVAVFGSPPDETYGQFTATFTCTHVEGY